MKSTVLIVDDHEMMRRFLGTFLSKNYEVYLAKDGIEALDWLEENENPSLIVTDIDMPRMNGYDFLNILKGNTNYSDIPVMMLSSANKSERRIKAYELGAHDVMSKPFNPRELELKLKTISTEVTLI